jgi:hypothetical protein
LHPFCGFRQWSTSCNLTKNSKKDRFYLSFVIPRLQNLMINQILCPTKVARSAKRETRSIPKAIPHLWRQSPKCLLLRCNEACRVLGGGDKIINFDRCLTTALRCSRFMELKNGGGLKLIVLKVGR